MRSKIILLVTLLCVCSASVGYSFAKSNLIGSYPSFSSRVFTPRPPLGKDEYSVSRYKAEVDKYIEKYEDYSMGAKNDLDDIERKLNTAEREVNQVVTDYRRFIMAIR